MIKMNRFAFTEKGYYMQQSLNVEDSSLLEIYKVKDYAIYFKYDGDRYLLHVSEDGYETFTNLYRKDPINNFGKFKLVWICNSYGNKIPDIQHKGQKKRIKNYYSIPNSMIDIERFIWDMTWNSFFSGKYYEEIENRKNKIKDVESAIKLLEKTKQLLHKMG